MSQLLFANNAGSTLAGNLTTSSLTIPLLSGTGALFPSPGAGQYFMLSLFKQTNPAITEIVRCTARTGDSLTVVRAQEGTVALTWSVGDIANNDLTAGSMQALVQASPYASGSDYIVFEIPGSGLIQQMGRYTSLTTTIAGSELFTFPTAFLNPSQPYVQLTPHSVSGTTDFLAPDPPNGTFSVHNASIDVNTPATYAGFKFWVGAENESSDVFNGRITTFDWMAVGPKA